MGIQTTDVFPLNPAFPTAITPASKDYQMKPVGVTRAMTTATKVAVLSAGSTILGVKYFPTVVSNAGTTAIVTLTATFVKTGTTVTLGTVDVKGSATSVSMQSANFFNLDQPDSDINQGDIIIKATYAETGTASTAGGPFYFSVEFVR